MKRPEQWQIRGKQNGGGDGKPRRDSRPLTPIPDQVIQPQAKQNRPPEMQHNPHEEGHSRSDEAEAAAIEFALLNLPVMEIIVCGHSECGAMQAIAYGDALTEAPNLKSWLRHGKGALKKLKNSSTLGNQLTLHNQVSQLNVLEQLDHLKTYPVVQKRLAEGSLRMHAWWFDIREADVYEYDHDEKKFHLIDEEYARVLLQEQDPPR